MSNDSSKHPSSFEISSALLSVLFRHPLILKFLSETQRFPKHLTICLYLLYSILSCFCTAVYYPHCLNVLKKYSPYSPDDNIQLCFCVNDSQTLSNAQKWNHNVHGRHYYGLCHFLLLVKGLYKVNRRHWRWCAKQTTAIYFLDLTHPFTFSKLQGKHFLLYKRWGALFNKFWTTVFTYFSSFISKILSIVMWGLSVFVSFLIDFNSSFTIASDFPVIGIMHQ